MTATTSVPNAMPTPIDINASRRFPRNRDELKTRLSGLFSASRLIETEGSRTLLTAVSSISTSRRAWYGVRPGGSESRGLRRGDRTTPEDETGVRSVLCGDAELLLFRELSFFTATHPFIPRPPSRHQP